MRGLISCLNLAWKYKKREKEEEEKRKEKKGKFDQKNICFL